MANSNNRLSIPWGQLDGYKVKIIQASSVEHSKNKIYGFQNLPQGGTTRCIQKSTAKLSVIAYFSEMGAYPLGGGEQSHRIPTAHAPAGPIWLQRMGNRAAKYLLPASTWKWDWVFKWSCHQDGKETLLRYWVWSVGSALTKSKESPNFSRFNRTVSPDNQESRKFGFDLLLLMATQSIIFMLKYNTIHNKKHTKFYNKIQSQNLNLKQIVVGSKSPLLCHEDISTKKLVLEKKDGQAGTSTLGRRTLAMQFTAGEKPCPTELQRENLSSAWAGTHHDCIWSFIQALAATQGGNYSCDLPILQMDKQIRHETSKGHSWVWTQTPPPPSSW